MQRRKEENGFVNTAGTRPFLGKPKFNRKSFLPIASLLLCVFALNLFSLSCTTKPSDLRTLVPAETLVYLETNDLAAALQPIVDSKPFREVAKSKPDFSALKGVQIAVAVTGFETSEVAVTDEQSVGKVQPRFVAVADTHAWNYQVVAFAEKKLGSFVTEIYDSEPKLEKSDKHGGKYFTWTSQDGRKAFALVIDSLIYFGNDESAIDTCMWVRNNDGPNLAFKEEGRARNETALAYGFITKNGVDQIASLAGVHFASQASDEEEVQRAVAGILPQLIRGTVTDVSWSTSQTSEGIEDKWSVRMSADVASTLSEAFLSSENVRPDLFGNIPTNADLVTLYNFKNPQTAWRSVVAVMQAKLDTFSGKLVAELSPVIFEPYGIRDPEMFLSNVDSNIVTTKFSSESEPIAIAVYRDYAGLTKSFSNELKIKPSSPNSDGPSFWSTEDGDFVAFFVGGSRIVLGDGGAVKRWPESCRDPNKCFDEQRVKQLFKSNTPITTIGTDNSTALNLIAFLAKEGHGDTQVVSTYLTETRFTKTGMERRTVSDLGFVGWMIAQLAAE